MYKFIQVSIVGGIIYIYATALMHHINDPQTKLNIQNRTLYLQNQERRAYEALDDFENYFQRCIEPKRGHYDEYGQFFCF